MNSRKGFGRIFRRFWREERGAVFILFAILAPVMLGIIGLALDGGRVLTVNNELQDLADAAAIAGARELDGTQEGMDAAVEAALNLLNNDPRWSNVTTDEEIQINQPIRFCSSPLVGAEAWSACTPTDDPLEADFIEIVTIEREVSPVLTVAVGGTEDIGTRAIAIAGTSIVACAVQPLMLCNPFEEDESNPEFHATPGQMFVFKQKGGGAGTHDPYAPGDFGLLDPPGANTSSTGPQLRNLLSQQTPKFCYVNNVSPRPGHNTGSVDTGINVRFDEQPTGTGQLTGLNQIPAPIVINGKVPKNQNNACGPQNDLGAVARMPRDTLPPPNGTKVQIGTARPTTAAKNNYWQFHHNATWPTGLATRYDAYLHEIQMVQDNAWGKSPAPESPTPTCAPVSAGTAERRILSVAVVDCLANGVQGNSVSNVRSDTYADFFITEPADSGTIYTEFVRMLTPGEDDGKLRRIVQLYR